MLVDLLAYRSSWRPVHPGEKLAFFLLVGFLGFLPLFSLHLGLLGVFPFLFLHAGVPFRFFIRLLRGPFLFLTLGVLVVMFSSRGGWREGLELGVRTMVLLNAFLFLASTTPVPDLLGFLRKGRFMEVFTDIAFLAYRYLFYFSQRAEQLLWAQRARWGYGSYRQSLRSLALLVGNLILFTVETAEKLRLALEARGFEGKLAVLLPDFRPVEGKRIAVLVGMGAGGILLVLLRRGVW